MPKTNDYSELVTPIIRSAGERTFAVCHMFVQREFPNCAVHVVEERPFSKALRRSFEIGLDTGKKWTLCIDADVLIGAGQLRHLLRYAEDLGDSKLFELQARVIDKLFTIRRPAGNHLYRSALLDKGLSVIPEAGLSLRPESDSINAMAELGYPWMQLPNVVGIHDFEQYYRDIYRKAFLQGRKFRHWAKIVLNRWHELAADDRDYDIALQAWKDSETQWDPVYMDNRGAPDRILQILASKGISEKAALNVNGLENCRVEEIVKGYQTEDKLKEWEQAFCFPFEQPLGPDMFESKTAPLMARFRKSLFKMARVFAPSSLRDN